MRYISFALGKGIGDPDPEYDWDEPEAAVGLESVAELIEEEGEGVLEDLGDYHVLSPTPKEEKLAGETYLDDTMKQCGSPTVSSFPDQARVDTSSSSTSAVEYNYGGLCDKVGEAAMCWLTRWGMDVYRFEQDEMTRNLEPMGEQQQAFAHLSHVTSPVTRKRAATIPSSSPADIASSSKPLFHIEAAVPRIWRRGGLTASWVRQVLSSDSLFVLGEKERYDLCRNIVDFRRREGIDPEEEVEWDTLFQRGIYYSTMVCVYDLYRLGTFGAK